MISVGSDPELMLKQGGNLVSALRCFSGRKHAPLSLKRGGSALSDNVNLEFNHPPADSAVAFGNYIANALEDVSELLPNFEFSALASAEFPREEMNDFEAFVFGCDPEFSAWQDGDVVFPPRIEDSNFFRSCGGHIHVGWEPARKNPLQLVRVMDIFVGVPLVMMDHDPSSKARHALYGGAGKFRPTRYGVEYRTPSNYWVRSRSIAECVFMLVDIAVEEVNSPVSADAMRAVQENDKHLAREVFFNVIEPRLPRFLADEITLYTDNPVGENVLKNWGIR